MEDNTHAEINVQPQSSIWLTPKDLQAELRIGERLTYRLLKDGTIPSIRLGGVYRVHRSQLETLGARSGLGTQT